MAFNDSSVPSSSSSATFPINAATPPPSSSWAKFVLSQEDMNTFHKVDRMLYARLVRHLGRNPVGSMHVMALWMWFERLGCYRGKLVNMMLDFSNNIIATLADEAVLILMCIEKADSILEIGHRDMPVTKRLTEAPLTLQFFSDHRAIIAPTILNIVNGVCVRVFRDIMQEAVRLQTSQTINNPRRMSKNHRTHTNYHVPNPNPRPDLSFPNSYQSHDFRFPSPNSIPKPNIFPNPNLNPNFHMPNHHLGANSNVPNPTPSSGFYTNPQNASPLNAPGPYQVNLPSSFPFFNAQTLEDSASSSSANVPQGGVVAPFPKEGEHPDPPEKKPSRELEIRDHKDFLNNELNDLLNSLHLEAIGGTGNDKDAAIHPEVPPAERTLFLTFSKGYPISENEVNEFFTRKYGESFEAIHMHEVLNPTDQPLFARLVARSVSTINVVLDGKSKAKFTINGKHMWARKFERRRDN